MSACRAPRGCRADGGVGAEPPERVDRRQPDVDVRVVHQRVEQSRDDLVAGVVDTIGPHHAVEALARRLLLEQRQHHHLPCVVEFLAKERQLRVGLSRGAMCRPVTCRRRRAPRPPRAPGPPRWPVPSAIRRPWIGPRAWSPAECATRRARAAGASGREARPPRASAIRRSATAARQTDIHRGAAAHRPAARAPRLSSTYSLRR